MLAIGIALEALFLDDAIREQHRYRLSLNGALWLEEALQQRLATAKSLARAYDARSMSVHASGNPKEETVQSARELAIRGVLLALERSTIPENWNDWIFERCPPA
jgi:hypothetical protein